MIASIQQRIDDLLAQMTLDEKLAQLTSCWMYELMSGNQLDMVRVSQRLQHGIGQITRPGGASALSPREIAQAINRLQRFLVEQTRLGIPAIMHEETCCGAMVYGGTMFPQSIGLASSFQPSLVEEMAQVIRRQLLAIGARQGLAPMLDLARDPRWGRVEETFGEDPTLVAHFGVAYIRGLQGESLRGGVLATGKHFIGHSMSQGGLNCAPVHMGWYELHDSFLTPFQAAIDEAQLGSVMNAYPELDGEVIATSRRLLTELLRIKLGFEGLLVSDYEAVQMIHTYHKAAPDLRRAAVLALKAGIDVELPTTVCYGDPLRTALELGEIDQETIDQAVRRHLQMKFDLGLFDNPYVDEDKVEAVFFNPENQNLARRLARSSLVLLKNDGLLPLNRSLSTLAVIGPNAHSGRNLLGDYSYWAQRELIEARQGTLEIPDNIEPPKVHSILEGLQSLIPPDTRIIYAQGCDNLSRDTSGFEEAICVARQADAVVLVLGDRSGFLPNCTTGETRDNAWLSLPGVQNELARAILDTGKPVAVVLVTGRPYVISELAERANAILQAWLPGEEGGMAIAEALLGDYNPGGKLPITFPRSVGQIPLFYNRKPSALTSHWHGDYVDETVKPLFPFGHGLSYTTFAYENLNIHPTQVLPDQVVEISLDVINCGSKPGDEVVQLYIHDEYASLPRPIKELKGYVRISLEAGERRHVIFRLPVNQLAFHNSDLCLVLEPGRIEVMVGSSSEDIRLRGEFEIVGKDTWRIARREYFCPVEVK